MARHKFVLGAKAFAAISAVEGKFLPADSAERLKELQHKGLTPDQIRAEIFKIYSGRKDDK